VLFLALALTAGITPMTFAAAQSGAICQGGLQRKNVKFL
jgi:hypothetical protein